MNSTSAAIRELLVESVRQSGDFPVLLSGGVDSSCVLAASLLLGRKPLCITYTTASRSLSSVDVKYASEMAEKHGLQHLVVTVPSDVNYILRDIELVLPFIVEHGLSTPESKPIYKVWVQCCIPMMYVCNALVRMGYHKGLTGFCADAYYGSGRAAAKLMASSYKEWDDYRIKYVEHPLNADWVVKKMAREMFHVDLHDCWVHEDVRRLMLSKTYDELNKPRSKWVAIEAFPEFWGDGRWWRENASLQVVGGVREDHDRLLSDPRANPLEHKAVIALYNDMAEMIVPNFRARALDKLRREKGEAEPWTNSLF